MIWSWPATYNEDSAHYTVAKWKTWLDQSHMWLYNVFTISVKRGLRDQCLHSLYFFAKEVEQREENKQEEPYM